MGRYSLRSSASPALSQSNDDSTSSVCRLPESPATSVRTKKRRGRRRKTSPSISVPNASSPSSEDKSLPKDLLLIDLQAINLDPKSLRFTHQPLELITKLFPLDLGPGSPALISCTYQVQKEKALDMPLLTSCPSPSPQSSVSSVSDTSWDSTGDDCHKTSDIRSSISSIRTTTSIKEKKSVQIVEKRKRCAKRKRTHYRAGRHDAVAESIIKDAETLELISCGRRPRFRILPKHPAQWVSNYRKAQKKICVRSIFGASYPNTAWSNEVNVGMSVTHLAEGPAPTSPLYKFNVFSNILVKANPGRDDKDNKENVPPTLDILNDNHNLNEKKTTETQTQKHTQKQIQRQEQGRKRKIFAPQLVDIFCIYEEEYEMLVERLGPDYQPVKHDKKAKADISQRITRSLSAALSDSSADDADGWITQDAVVYTQKSSSSGKCTSHHVERYSACSTPLSSLGVKDCFVNVPRIPDNVLIKHLNKPSLSHTNDYTQRGNGRYDFRRIHTPSPYYLRKRFSHLKETTVTVLPF